MEIAEVPIESAYASACQTIGEKIIQEKINEEVLRQKNAYIAMLEGQLKVAIEAGFVVKQTFSGSVIEEAIEIVEKSDTVPSEE